MSIGMKWGNCEGTFNPIVRFFLLIPFFFKYVLHTGSIKYCNIREKFTVFFLLII